MVKRRPTLKMTFLIDQPFSNPHLCLRVVDSDPSEEEMHFLLRLAQSETCGEGLKVEPLLYVISSCGGANIRSGLLEAILWRFSR